MEVYERAGRLISDHEDHMDLRKGQWTEEEDSMLKSYVNIHGEGRWNSVAGLTGLKRSGKSCRLRWMNYLRPEVRRGNISLQEQLLILQLHSQWGNKWSKIAQHLPGRTDNEIKNYWRTRVQKQARQLKCEVNSKQFSDAMRYVWIPRLIERISASSESQSVQQPMDSSIGNMIITPADTNGSVQVDPSVLPELSGTTSSDDTYAQVSSSVPFMSDCYVNPESVLQNGSGLCSDNLSGRWNIEDGVEFDARDDDIGGESMESVWNEENIWFLRQQLYGDDVN